MHKIQEALALGLPNISRVDPDTVQKMMADHEAFMHGLAQMIITPDQHWPEELAYTDISEI
jgi:hypothetical protein